MITIKTLQDLTSLRAENASKQLPSSLLQHLENHFRQLYEALSDCESLEEFSLHRHGYFVVLDRTDNPSNLREVGLNPEDGGLLASWPEYVERLPDGWHKVALLYDNDYMMFFYLQGTKFDKEVQQWLTEQADKEIRFSLPEVQNTLNRVGG